MKYYNEEKKEVNFDLSSMHKDLLDDTGSQGVVYKYGTDQCIKFYYSEQPRGLFAYTKKIFEFFKKLDLENYCKLRKEFYREETLKNIGAFTMNYYQKTETSLLDMPTEYILHNFEIHYRNAKILAENKILTHDLHKKNIIIGSENMTIIDFESYYQRYLYTYNHLLRKNTIILLKLMKALYFEELKKFGLNNPKNIILLEELFEYNEEPVKKLTKELKGIKKTIDLF